MWNHKEKGTWSPDQFWLTSDFDFQCENHCVSQCHPTRDEMGGMEERIDIFNSLNIWISCTRKERGLNSSSAVMLGIGRWRNWFQLFFMFFFVFSFLWGFLAFSLMNFVKKKYKSNKRIDYSNRMLNTVEHKVNYVKHKERRTCVLNIILWKIKLIIIFIITCVHCLALCC